MEGKTDVQYLNRASVLLGREKLLAGIEIKEGGGKDSLGKIWNAAKKLPDDLVVRPMMMLFDCDYRESLQTNGNRMRRKIKFLDHHPVKKGIENLFSQATLDKAIAFNKAFIDIGPGGPGDLRWAGTNHRRQMGCQREPENQPVLLAMRKRLR